MDNENQLHIASWYSFIKTNISEGSNVLLFSAYTAAIKEMTYLGTYGMRVVGIHLDPLIQPYVELKREGKDFDHNIKGISITSIMFPMQYFDRIVFARQSFETIPYDSNRQYVLGFCHRMLKPNGELLMQLNQETSYLNRSTITTIQQLAGTGEYLVKDASVKRDASKNTDSNASLQFRHFFTPESLTTELHQAEFDLSFHEELCTADQFGVCCRKCS
jgi:SAM-dependent methyltransferase